MGIVDKVKKIIDWKPPSSKESGIINADTLYSNETINYVEMYYNDNKRVVNANEDGTIDPNIDLRYNRPGKNTKAVTLNIDEAYYLNGSRVEDPKYNDRNAPLQIHCFGDSWTYGWCLEQEQSFPHLLGDKDTTIHNYGAGGTGLDFAVKTLSEVYIPESRRQIFIITVPHFFRRTWFDDDGVVLRAWQVKEKVNINEYNNYFYFLHHYNMLNTFVGRDKIIWGTWDGDLPAEHFDVNFDLTDLAEDNLHPGPIAHKEYAEKIKNVLQDRFK